MIPDLLKAEIDRLLEGVSRNQLAERSAALSSTYRAQGGSQQAIRSRADALAYLVARLPATYAAVTACLRQIQSAMPDFSPASLLDAGAGPGGASHAAFTQWQSLSQATLLDENPHLLAAGKTLAPSGWTWLQTSLLSASLPQADLVIASYTLGEIPEATEVLDRLWQATKSVLVIVEPGTPAGYNNIVRWRTYLLTQGASIAAPCPHDLPCPIVSPDWCHFSQRLPRSRDHLFLKNASVPFEDEKFSYCAATRLPIPNRPAGRIVAPPLTDRGGITAKVCTQGRIDIVTAAKRDPISYKAMRKKDWGEGI